MYTTLVLTLAAIPSLEMEPAERMGKRFIYEYEEMIRSKITYADEYALWVRRVNCVLKSQLTPDHQEILTPYMQNATKILEEAIHRNIGQDFRHTAGDLGLINSLFDVGAITIGTLMWRKYYPSSTHGLLIPVMALSSLIIPISFEIRKRIFEGSLERAESWLKTLTWNKKPQNNPQETQATKKKTDYMRINYQEVLRKTF
jgi:hypothetical protein